MTAVVLGHEVDIIDRSGVEGGIDRISPRIGDGARWQPDIFVGVIGRIKFEITLMNDPVKLFDPA